MMAIRLIGSEKQFVHYQEKIRLESDIFMISCLSITKVPFIIDFRNYKSREGKMKSLVNKPMFSNLIC
jgi:hypothetical protein